MTDVTPDAISQIATRLFQEAQAVANGSPPSLGVLPLAPTSPIGLPSKTGLSPTAMPEPVQTPLSRAPGRGITTELPFREQLPTVPNDPHLTPPFSTMPGLGDGFEETTYAAPPAKFEAGTPNIADAVGLGAALDYVTRLGLPNIAEYEHELLEYGRNGSPASTG